MGYEIPGFQVGEYPANVDMSAKTGNLYTYQYTGVRILAATGSVQGYGKGGAAIAPPSAGSTPVIGVLQNAPTQGSAGTIMIDGVSKAVAGGTFHIGDLLFVDTDGKFYRAAPASGKFAVAQALEDAVVGDICAVLLVRNGIQ